jgi:hypothetical protein
VQLKRRRSRSTIRSSDEMHRPVGCIFRFVFAESRNLSGQRQPEAFLHTNRSGALDSSG